MKLDSTSVALQRCSSYQCSQLMECFDSLIRAIDGPFALHGRQVLLKPNLLTAGRGALPCTEAAFILAAARWFLDAGAKVAIGDSPAFGSARVNLDRLGIAQELLALGVDISDFRRTRILSLDSGVNAGVAVRVLECDLLVNLPRIKAHAQTRVTMAVKNCFGCLTGLQKPWWHMIYGGPSGHFADLLVRLLALLPETITLVDGVRAMHRTGPINGEPYPLRVVAAGANPVAVDTAFLRLLDIPDHNSPLQVAAMHRKIVGSSSEEITYPLASLNDLQVHDFRVPGVLNPIRFRPFSFVFSAVRRAMGTIRSRLG
ncbi:MAG TPA: DUF362 domain-containing protein [Desulfobulbaceae bacterium]|nr:DUF362 domain-containing protein [Desulfobulbaceae bacterium]